MIVNNELEKNVEHSKVHFEVLYWNISGGTEKIVTNKRMTPVPIKILTGPLPIKETNLTSCVNSFVEFKRNIKFIRREFQSR